MSPVLTEKQNENAQKLCSKMRNPNARKKAYLNFASAMYFADYMLEKGNIVSTKRSILNSHMLYEDFEVADVYCNYHRIYVLSADNTDYIKIPTAHVKYGIMPEYYAVVEISIISNTASVLGGINPESINLLEEKDGYFLYPKNAIKDVSELEKITASEMVKTHSVGKHLDCIKLFDYYVKGALPDDDKKKMIEHVLSCETCKKRLLETLELNEDKHENFEVFEYEDFQEKTYSKDSFLNKLKKDSSENFSQLKGAIDLFYKEKEINAFEKDTFLYKVPPIFKTRKMLFLFGVVFLITFVFIISALSIPKTKKTPKDFVGQDIITQDELVLADDEEDVEYGVKIPKIRENKGYATVSNVSWEVSSNVNKESQKRFLQQIGKNIRLNLQNDLLLSSEAIMNSKVKYEIIYYKDGSIESIENIKSSGSEAIDEIIKQSVENTLQYAKPPKGSFVGKRNSLILNIQF